MQHLMRRSAVQNWVEMYAQAVNEEDIEDKYFKLLRRADDMESTGLINGREWRKLVRRAGVFLASTAE
ncbi:hypothetical protein EXW72_06885 [Pseudomonas sp. BCA14]|uniref:hypothetical protein n=1 Tax=unclassified Pseudomonas TaxID=196821 RepID=UPI00106E7625|nr:MULTISPECIES: hypothetical protein [unclassified Pseudomonas]TFF14000.1 hypothetical protein EXW70_05605 [Pseudomonas sp. JMN1]TFF15317.1 hypothetical protein EXW71_03435 [Pseudomonas sp. BCA17]TFF31724.1 hypothetical protein EXW72_06885 [Pseudomonas sp. BCA14]TFF32676.1 hypothetical protein EXW73_02685 [Pseudomonas sp. BCA13]